MMGLVTIDDGHENRGGEIFTGMGIRIGIFVGTGYGWGQFYLPCHFLVGTPEEKKS